MPGVRKGGTIIVNTSLAVEAKPRDDVNYVFAPLTSMAEEKSGNVKMTNIIALGLLAKSSGLISLDELEKALDTVIPPHRKNLLPLNKSALEMGYKYDLLPINC